MRRIGLFGLFGLVLVLMFTRPGRQVICVHRGGAPENTLEGLAEVLDPTNPFAKRPDMIEIDVRLSKDGVPVLMHDETLDRTTPFSGRVDAYTASELGRMNVPTLRQALNLIPFDVYVLMDVKDPEHLTNVRSFVGRDARYIVGIPEDRRLETTMGVRVGWLGHIGWHHKEVEVVLISAEKWERMR